MYKFSVSFAGRRERLAVWGSDIGAPGDAAVRDCAHAAGAARLWLRGPLKKPCRLGNAAGVSPQEEQSGRLAQLRHR